VPGLPRRPDGFARLPIFSPAKFFSGNVSPFRCDKGLYEGPPPMICRDNRPNGAQAAEWELLVREHGTMVFRTAWRIVGNAADAEDIAQEVFLEAHRLRARQVVQNWGGMLRRLATCRSLDRLRERKNVLSLDVAVLAGTSSDPTETAIERELAERLRVAITQLPRREAEVFCMRFFEGLGTEQIAHALQIATGAVGVALHKARTKLEGLLGEDSDEETSR
jgi:RNA polymerase sigma-70 factor (ECF subfamily)